MAGDSDLSNNITPTVEILIQLVLYKDYGTSTLEYPKNPNLGFKIKNKIRFISGFYL